MRYFVTGATGTIGAKVLKKLVMWQKEVYWGSRRWVKTDRRERYFDFNDPKACALALQGIDVLFLMRPPSLSEHKIIPIVDNAVLQGVKHIVFMSVQGAENMPFIPHAAVERHLLKRHQVVAYTFLRPGYFMENLTGVLKQDIQTGTLYLPAGSARFAWTSGKDIALAAANIMVSASQHAYKAYTLTGKEFFNFYELCTLMQEQGIFVNYQNTHLLSFYQHRRSQGDSRSFAFITGMIHYLQRFQNVTLTSDFASCLSVERPLDTLHNFIGRHASEFSKNV